MFSYIIIFNQNQLKNNEHGTWRASAHASTLNGLCKRCLFKSNQFVRFIHAILASIKCIVDTKSASLKLAMVASEFEHASSEPI